MADGITPNRRLNDWAENRHLSIDTAGIIAHCDERENQKKRKSEENQRQKSARKTQKGDGDPRSTRSGGSDNPRRAVFGCFSFLPICKR